MSDQFFNEALLAVANAEEYASKILALQQACLRPLKEDLADWLNKIMSTSLITSDNFMNKLDNGVIICRLAKIISGWCLENLQIQDEDLRILEPDRAIRRTMSIKISSDEHRDPQNIYHELTNIPPSSTSNENKVKNLSTAEHGVQNCSENAIPYAIVNPLGKNSMGKRMISSNNPTGINYSQLRSSTSQSTNCLISASYSSVAPSEYGRLFTNSYGLRRFIDNLIQMEQTKIWEEARCRTFYARDNVCNFIRWSKEFGVNQSVLFESDDLVLHANPRQVVLCLLDVARIACVKHGFTEAPGLVKFEQQIEAEAAQTALSDNEYHRLLDQSLTTSGPYSKLDKSQRHIDDINKLDEKCMNHANFDLSNPITSGRARLKSINRVRASIGDATDELILRYCKHKEEQQAKDRARTNSSLSLTSDLNTNSLSTSPDDLSSSRSSLLSGNGESSTKDQDPMDLDGKVMRIAKSYYGKGARRGVTRLSEGKYKIADRIVFVRLLKGHRVMVRIGGGWDTLENFLFRHKSDPSQVIDVDNLLPLESKMTLENNIIKNNQQSLMNQQQQQQNQHNNPNLSYYKRSDSASSTNLSLSNRSISANSPSSSSIISHHSNHYLLQAHLSNVPSLSVGSSTPSSPVRLRSQTTAKSRDQQQSSPNVQINRGKNLDQLPQSIAVPTSTSSTSSGLSSVQHLQGAMNSKFNRQQPSTTPTNSRIPQHRSYTVHKLNRATSASTKHLSNEHKSTQNLSLLPATSTSTRPMNSSTAITATKTANQLRNIKTQSYGSKILNGNKKMVSSAQNLHRITTRGPQQLQQNRQNLVRKVKPN